MGMRRPSDWACNDSGSPEVPESRIFRQNRLPATLGASWVHVAIRVPVSADSSARSGWCLALQMVRGAGGPGGYRWGIERQRGLLAREGSAEASTED